MNTTKPTSKPSMTPHLPKQIPVASHLSALLLAIAALFAGLLTASAEITPYSWQRFTTLKAPGLDSTGLNHPIAGGFTGGGESPFGTMPVDGNIAVGGPLGTEGYFSSFAIRSRANAGSGQGCAFQEPTPVSVQTYAGATKTNENAWGNLFQTNSNWAVECWAMPTRVGGNGASPIFYTGLNRNNRSVGLESGVMMLAINGPDYANQSMNDGHVYLRCQAICPSNKLDTNGLTQSFYIGPPVLFKSPTNAEWMHIAVVRDEVAGTVAWYTNGVMVASTNSWRVVQTNHFSSPGFAGAQDSGILQTVPGGVTFDGSARPFEGYIAELRWSYFAPGQFSLTNLLTRRVSAGSPTVWYGPSIVKDPQNITVWTGGAAPFTVVPSTDTTLTYQWQRAGVNVTDATNRAYVLENAQLADSGAQFRCIVTKPANSLTATSAVATVTVVNNNLGIVNGYSNAVMAEVSLKAYFPGDATSSGTNLINVKDATHNGNIFNMPAAFRNGNTNIAAGNQALSLNTPNQGYTGGYGLNTNQYGYVEIAGDGAGYNFTASSGGNGTIEAVLYMEPSALNVLSTELLCWFSSCSVPGTTDYYQFLANYDGYVFYQNQVTGTGAGQLVWFVPGGLVGKRTHIAFTFQGGTNVTCYANGVSLGTKKQVSFGPTPPSATQPLTIGMRGGNNNAGGAEPGDNTGYMRNVWRGSVDDFAIYGTNLSANAIASHSFILNNGTTPTAPSVAKISPSKSLYTGFPVQILNVTAGGSPPFGYQWRSNGVALSGQTSPALTITNLSVNSYNYTVVITNSLGSITSAPVVLTVVNPAGYAAKVFASSGGGPRAFWPLDEVSGTDILDWAGTHDGVISGGYTLGQQGPVVGTGSIRMYGTNGAGANFSQIFVPFYPELNSYKAALDLDGNNSLTAYDGRYSYEFWYRPDSSNAICAISSQFNIGTSRAGAAVYLGYTGADGENQTTFRHWTMRIGRFFNTNQGVNQNGSGGPTPPPLGEWCHVCLVVDAASAGDKAFVYMNGVLEDSDGTSYSTDPNASFIWNANNISPLIMGNRNRGALGTLPMFGALSQVAVYDYPLTISDITNHLSQIWAPASFTLNPVNASGAEGFTTSVTLTAKAIGIPNSYVWVKDGVELTPVNNFDGTAHYPVINTVAGDQQGTFSPKLVINQLRPSDAGSYWLRVYNPMNTNTAGVTNSVAATVTITADATFPALTDVGARGTMVSGPVIDEATSSSGNPTPAPLFLVQVKFSKRKDPTTATNPANYFISGGVTVTNVVIARSVADTKFGGDYKTVGLITSGLTPGASYTVTVSNVLDQAATPKLAPTASISFTAPSLTVGRAVWSYYYRFTYGGDTFAGLSAMTNAVFPYVPQVVAAMTNFSSDAIALNQSLGNNSLFAGQADTYVSTIAAWVTPTNTGFYEFFINGDEKARLYLNASGADPAGAVWIGDSFTTGTQFSDIYAIPTHYQLTVGQPYFLQAVLTENTGNDHVRVGWRYLGTVDVAYDGSGANGAWIVDATNLPPIQSTYLSANVAGPVINTQPFSIVAAAGTTTNLTVSAATSSGIATYQWQVNNGNTGTSTNRLFFAPLAFANFSLNYKVIVSDGTLSITSSVVSVTPPAPSIVTSPTSKAATFGLANSLTVVPATFSGRTNYLWQLTSTNASGANYSNSGTNRILTIASMQATNAGPYQVVVNDGFTSLSLTSTVATLSIAVNPVITNSTSGAILNMTFPTEVGPQYVIEFKNALTNGAWNSLSTNAGNGSAFTVPVGTTNAQRYFRLRMQ